MSFSETIFLFFLALIIFGPKKLPEIARQVGKYLNEFKRASNEFKAQIEQEIAHLESAEPQILPPNLTSASMAGDTHVTESLAPEGTASRSLNSSTLVNGESSNAVPAATLAAALVEDSKGHESSEVARPVSKAADFEPAPVSNPTTDAVNTDAAQESHA